jgi:LytS/YehU family sensor histidine kinase
VRNRYATKANADLHAEGGIGLENLRRRLQLQYPRHHQFEIVSNTDIYLVRLTIDI